MTRRESLAAIGAVPLAAAVTQTFDSDLVRRHDEAVDYYLKNQVADPKSRWRGALPDSYGLHAPGTAVGIWEVMTAAFCCPQSRHAKRRELIERIELAAAFVDRSSSPEGNIYLPITNFNSPPDSAFAVRSAANTFLIARNAGASEITRIVEPRLKRMAAAITTGGIHTPNHRWVVCAALAQMNELFPDPAYIRRIDQWLAEGIDIDSDGQWSERSTAGYNAITNSAFVVMADKLKRPELFEPVRHNFDSMMYLLHADGEVETGFSTRQDLNTRATMASYWMPLQYFGVKLGDKRCAALAKELWPKGASLSVLMAYPELNRSDAPAAPLPSDFVKELPHNYVVRIRRGLTSVTIHTRGRERFLSLRRGDAVINGVRFASAFFGKAQFRPQRTVREGDAWTLVQELDGPYFQPFTPTRKIGADEWDDTQPLRPRTQVCRLSQSARIQELPNGVRLLVEAAGTDDVPLAIEINLREGGKLDGAAGNLLTEQRARFTLGAHSIQISGGGCEHKYTDIRGALPKLPGQSVYITGLTPFRRTIDFTWE